MKNNTEFLITAKAFIVIILLIALISPVLSQELMEEPPKEEVKKEAPKKGNDEEEKKVKKKDEREFTGEMNANHDDSMLGTVEYQVVLKDDNADSSLPNRYRNWWYVKLEGVDTLSETRLHIERDGFPGESMVIPVYSYDNANWERMRPENVIPGEAAYGSYNYTIVKKFDRSKVWVARYYPYTYERLQNYVSSIKKNPLVKVESIGKTRHNRDIYMVTVTDTKTDNSKKRRVWIHARTHPSETGSSFLVEGLINYLISECNEGCKEADLSKLIFNIVPMVNIDGVVEGRARVAPETSQDLERMWLRDKKNGYNLRDTCPPEVKAIHNTITNFDKKGSKFFMALNVHTKNAEPEWTPFVYTNFYSKNEKLGEEADSMFFNQISFIKILSDEYPCKDTLNMRPSFERDLPLSEKHYPEAWWWANFKDDVMAATFELTSGYDGCFEEWVTYKDHLLMGEAVAKAIYKYYRYFISHDYARYEAPETNMDELLKYYRDYVVRRQ